MLHIDNISHVISFGFVHKDSPFANPEYVVIGDQSVIDVRETKLMIDGSTIGSHIPFYFGPRSPMLYVIQHGYNGVQRYPPNELVYCVVRLDDIIKNDINCLFTDGHPLNYLTVFYDKKDLTRINEIIKHEDVYTRYWNNEDDRDLKRRKEAELLVLDELNPKFIKGFIVYDKTALEKLVNMGVNQDKVLIIPEYYF